VQRAAFLLRLLGFLLGAAALRKGADVLTKAAEDVTRNCWRAIADDHPCQRPREYVYEDVRRLMLYCIVEQRVRGVQVSQLDLLRRRTVGESGKKLPPVGQGRLQTLSYSSNMCAALRPRVRPF
jgi:hypothetical protein